LYVITEISEMDEKASYDFSSKEPLVYEKIRPMRANSDS
jgi:hypothetical protein